MLDLGPVDYGCDVVADRRLTVDAPSNCYHSPIEVPVRRLPLQDSPQSTSSQSNASGTRVVSSDEVACEVQGLTSPDQPVVDNFVLSFTSRRLFNRNLLLVSAELLVVLDLLMPLAVEICDAFSIRIDFSVDIDDRIIQSIALTVQALVQILDVLLSTFESIFDVLLAFGDRFVGLILGFEILSAGKCCNHCVFDHLSE